jgi:hypothetical protein
LFDGALRAALGDFVALGLDDLIENVAHGEKTGRR